MHFEIVGPAPMQKDDIVQTADGIRRGDVVSFERTAPDELLMRVIPPEQVATLTGAKYHVDKGSTPQAIRLTFLPTSESVAGTKIVAATRAPDGSLIPANNDAGKELAYWLDNGVPAVRGFQENDVMIDKWVIVAPDEPFFHLAVLEAIEERDWIIED